MINARRVSRIRVFLYTCIVLFLLLPFIFMIIFISIILALGEIENKVEAVASRVEDAAVYIEQQSVRLENGNPPVVYQGGSSPADISATPLPSSPADPPPEELRPSAAEPSTAPQPQPQNGGASLSPGQTQGATPQSPGQTNPTIITTDTGNQPPTGGVPLMPTPPNTGR